MKNIVMRMQQQNINKTHTRMHGSQHARYKLVNAVAFLYQRYKGRDTTLIVSDVAEVREYKLLKVINLVLQRHEVRDCLVALVRVVDDLEADVLFVLERAVELGVLMVEGQLGEQVVDVLVDKGTVASHALAGHATRQRLKPATVRHGLAQRDRVALLEHLVHRDEGLEGLNLIGEDWLSTRWLSANLVQSYTASRPSSVVSYYSTMPILSITLKIVHGRLSEYRVGWERPLQAQSGEA